MNTPSLELYLSMSDMFGIGPEVRQLLDNIGDLRPEGHTITLPKLLTDTRARGGLALPDIHARCGISRSQLAFYENGVQKNPGLRTMHALSHGYNLPFGLILLAVLNNITPLPQTKKGHGTNG